MSRAGHALLADARLWLLRARRLEVESVEAPEAQREGIARRARLCRELATHAKRWGRR